MTGWNQVNRIGETPLYLHLRRPRGPDRLFGSDVVYVSDVSPLIDRIEETPSLHYGTSPRRPANYPDVVSESNRIPQWCFSHLNQLDEFVYWYSKLYCIYSTTHTHNSKKSLRVKRFKKKVCG